MDAYVSAEHDHGNANQRKVCDRHERMQLAPDTTCVYRCVSECMFVVYVLRSVRRKEERVVIREVGRYMWWCRRCCRRNRVVVIRFVFTHERFVY
jgi:hypothetical protein